MMAGATIASLVWARVQKQEMFESVTIVGRGRVGSAMEARVRAREVRLTAEGGALVVLCVPDAAIAGVASSIAPGPWIAHVSGAVSLAALSPHRHRFSVHPLQTFNRSGEAAQFDGAWGAVTAEDEEGRERGMWLARILGLRPFELQDDSRAAYHAGAVIASNYLVTLYRSASRLLTAAGAPPEALVPLMRRTMDNGFDLTGPIARGDWATVEAHLDALARVAPDLEPMYRALADATRR